MKRTTDSAFPLIEALDPPDPARPHTSSWLNQRYHQLERRLAYPQTDDSRAWGRWRRNLRQALHRTLKLKELGGVPTPAPEVLEESPCDGYRRLKIAYETLPGNWISAYLLLPPGDRRKPAVLCPHGHVQGGKQGVVDPDIAPGLAYGHELARQGVVRRPRTRQRRHGRA